MSISFETKQCPLCTKVLRYKPASGVHVYMCPTNVELPGNDKNGQYVRSHYEVEIDNKMDVQHMYIGEYSIDNFANANKSRLYRWSQNNHGEWRWKFVVEVARIRADLEEKLSERIITFLAFL